MSAALEPMLAPAVGQRSTPPAQPPPAPHRAWLPPPVVDVRLGNGLRVLAVERASVPLVYLSWLAPAGRAYDPAGLEGLAALTLGTLAAGCAPGPDGEVPELLCGLDRDHAQIGLGVLDTELESGLGQLLHALTPSDRIAAALESARRRRLAELAGREGRAADCADDTLARALHGGAAESLERIGAQDVLDFWRRHLLAFGATLLAVGSLRADALRAALEPRVPVLYAAPARPPVNATSSAVRRIVVVDFPGAVQCELRVGQAGAALGDSDLAGLELLALVLGGFWGSRLHRSLRERRGWAYHVGCAVMPRRDSGALVVSTAVAPEQCGLAIGEILGELERLRHEPVAEPELERARRHLHGAELRRWQTLLGTLGKLKELAISDDQTELMRLAHRRLQPEAMTLVAVGPAATLERQLARWGEVEILSRQTARDMNLACKTQGDREMDTENATRTTSKGNNP